MSAKVLGSAVIPISMGLDKLDGQLAAARAKVDAGTTKMGRGMEKVGGTLTRTLTPAAAGFAVASKQAFGEWDSGFDSIRAQTGATGDELDALGESLKKVGANNTQGLAVIGEVMGEVAARTGLTGEPLETLTDRLLKLDRLGNGMSAESATRFFGDWGIAAEDGAAALDSLFRVSQETGVGMEKLADLSVAFGAPMRELGFGVDESTALLAKFEKEGVNTEGVLAGLKISVAKFAKEGKTPAEGLAATIAEMERLGPGAEATTLAMETFGRRAGIDVAKAVEEGRFNIEDLLATVKGGEETITTAADDTLDWGDKLGMLRNKVFAALGPVGEYGMALGGIGTIIGPAISGTGKMLKGVPKLGKAVGSIPSKMWGAAKSVGSLTTSLASNAAQAGRTAASAAVSGAKQAAAWATTGAKAAAATAKTVASIAVQGARWVWLGVQALAQAAKVAAAWVISMGPIALVGAAVAGLVVLIIKHWDTIKRVIAAAWEGIKKGVSMAWGAIKTLISTGLNVIKQLFLNFTGPGLLIKHWETIKRTGAAVWTFLRGKWDSFVSFVRGIPGRIASAGRGMWDWIKTGFRSAVNWIIRAWNGLEFRIPGFDPPGPGPKFGGFTLGVPNIPMLASGGDVWGAGLAVVGEAGPELAWLPEGASVHSNADSGGLLAAAANSGGGWPERIEVPLYIDRDKVGSAVIDFTADHSKRNGYRNPFKK